MSAEQQLVFDRAYAWYHKDGAWPKLEDLQREIAAQRPDVLVRGAVGSLRNYVAFDQPDELVHLSLRALATVAEARPLLEAYWKVCVDLIRRYRDRSQEASFTSEDLKAFHFDPILERELSRLLVEDHWGLGTGSGSPKDGWSYKIDERVLAASDAATLEEFLAARFDEPLEPPPPPVPQLTTLAIAPSSLDGDQPIDTVSQDILHRGPMADMLASEATSRLRAHGFVIGVSGPWGSGKTSVLNLAAEAILTARSGYVVRFDPWLFSDTEELVVRFLSELAAQLKNGHDMRELAGRISDYAVVLAPLTAFIPVPGASVGGNVLSSLLKRRTKRPQTSAVDQRRSVRELLAKLDKPLVVLVDDIDRLDRNEIRDVFRLVKLVADFPNTVYVLAFDELRVARALTEGEDDDEGYAFLEKIVQVTHDVPPLPRATLAQVLADAMSAAIGDVGQYKFNPDTYTATFGALCSLFSTVRDIRRYINELPGTLTLVGKEIDLVDVLLLEALRARVPSSFALLTVSRETLTLPTAPDLVQPRDTAPDAQQVENILDAAGRFRASVATILRNVFPVAGRYLGGGGYNEDWLPVWRREGRVAHREVLDIYMSRALPPGVLPVGLVEQAVEVLEDEGSLSRLLSELDAEQLESLLDRLEDYEGRFPTEHPDVPIAVLYNQRSRLREGVRDVLDPGANAKVTRVISRLLRKLDSAGVNQTVRAALPKLPRLTDQRDLIGLVGHRHGEGLGLISEDDASALEAELVAAVLSADASELSEEKGLMALFSWSYAADPRGTAASLAELINDDDFLVALLRAAAVERVSQPMAGGAVRHSFELNWELLAMWIPEASLAAAIQGLATDPVDATLNTGAILLEAKQVALGVETRHGVG